MTHVFHAYAAYKPPFKRSMAPLTTQTEGDADTSTPAWPTEPVDSSPDALKPSVPVETSPEPSFTHLPPQSRSEVIGEARALFSRIFRPSPDPTCSSSLPALPDVHVTPRLLSAYLSVFYAHAPLETAHEMFPEMCLRRTRPSRGCACARRGHSSAAANARRGSERAYVRSFAGDAWQEWMALEKCEEVEVDTCEE